MTDAADADDDLATTSRRHFLRGGVAIGGAALATGLAGAADDLQAADTRNLPPNVPEWMKVPGDPMGSQL